MPDQKHILRRSDDDLNKIIKDDFEASEATLKERWKLDFMVHQAFHMHEFDDDRSFLGFLDDNARGRPVDSFDDEDEHNKAYLPFLRSVVLAAESMVLNATIPDYNRYMDLEGAPGEEKQVRNMLDMIMHHRREAKWIREYRMQIRYALLAYAGIMYVGWKEDFAWVPKVIEGTIPLWDAVTGSSVPSDWPEEKRVHYERVWGGIDGIEYRAVNPFRFRYDPRAGHDGFDSCLFAGMVYRIPREEAERYIEGGFFLEGPTRKALAVPGEDKGEGGMAEDYEEKHRKDQKLDDGSGSDPDYDDKRYIHVRQYHTRDAVIFQLGGKHIVRKAQMFSYPFTKVVAFEEPGLFSGGSLGQYLLSAQHDINVMHRMKREQQDRATTPTRVVDLDFFDSLGEAKYAAAHPEDPIVLTRTNPGKDPRAAVFDIVPPSNTAPDIPWSMNLSLELNQKAASISANMQGSAIRSGGGTATETERIAQGVGSAHDDRRKRFEDDGVTGSVPREIKLIHLKQKKMRRIRVLGLDGATDWPEITPGDMVFITDPTLKAIGSSTMGNKQVDLRLFQEALQFVASMPTMAQYLKPLEAARALFVELGRDPEQVLQGLEGPDQPLRQEIENVLLIHGTDVPIRPDDDHLEHLEKIKEFAASEEFEVIPEAGQRKIEEHGLAHKRMLDMQQMGVTPAMMTPGGGLVVSGGGNRPPLPIQPGTAAPGQGGGQIAAAAAGPAPGPVAAGAVQVGGV